MKLPADAGKKILLASAAFLLLSHVTMAQDHLVAYWSFDSVSADTFYDVTGHGHDAVGTGDSIGITEGISGKALNCRGKGFDIVVKNSINDFALNNFTIETWVYSYVSLQNPGSFYNYKLVFDNSLTGMGGSGIRGGYGLSITDVGAPNLSASTPDETDWMEARSDSTLIPGRWYHLAGTYDGNMMKIFVNGRLTGSLSYVGGFKRTPVPARIGCQFQVYGETGATGLMRDWFVGKIDEMKLYNYAIDDQTIANHAQVPGSVSAFSIHGATLQNSRSSGNSVSYFNRTLAVSGECGPAEIRVSTVKGVLLENRLSGSGSGVREFLDLKKYPSGAYMYCVLFANSAMKTGRFIVEK
jgi:hypothetical protein